MRRKRDSLSSIVASAISEKISTGVYELGSKIPAEMQLCEEYNVSRTVVREAIAQLRSEGLLRSQQGVGVFVADDGALALKIPREKSGELSEILDILELRLGVEIEAAGLAAARRTPESLQKITDALRACEDIDAFIQRPREMDFAFHMAIAEASANSYMPKFMSFIGPVIIPRSSAIYGGPPEMTREYLTKMLQEHQIIHDAIAAGDVLAAKAAMDAHLSGSLERHRALTEA